MWGLKASLEQLIDSGQLRLQVIYDLHSLNEPIANSAWIDAREDIYRFSEKHLTMSYFTLNHPMGKQLK